MNTKRLAIEINILRCLHPTVMASRSSTDKLAKQLEAIKKEVDACKDAQEGDIWKQFQKETYATLQGQSEISAIYEKRKSLIIGDHHLAEYQLDDGTKVRFDKNANCLLIDKDGETEVL